MEYISSTISISAGRLQEDIETITNNAQAAFAQAQAKIEALLSEAAQNAGRVDQGVRDMNTLKAELGTKITEHENAITQSGQAAVAAHDRLSAQQVELDAYAGRTEITVQEIKTAGDLTRTQTMEEFQKWRSNMEL